VPKKYECNRCEQVFAVDEAFEVCTFKGSQEEPAEYDHLCPHCNSSDIEIMDENWCANCGDIEVKEEGNICSECMTCAAEIENDRRKDEESLTNQADEDWKLEREEMARMPPSRRFP